MTKNHIPLVPISSLRLGEAHDCAYEETHHCVSSPEDLAVMRQLGDWANEYLCGTHPDLGRDGPVCPFTKPSVERSLFWFRVDRTLSLSSVEKYAEMATLADRFMTLAVDKVADERYKTILTIFPNLRDTGEVDHLQRQLKDAFVKRGLMVGQFYDGCPEPGLWNPQFKPLQSPVPLLAIRHMVPSDFPFVVSEDLWLTGYLTRFAPDLPPHVRGKVVNLVRQSFLHPKGSVTNV